jgi:hypothetical protein
VGEVCSEVKWVNRSKRRRGRDVLVARGNRPRRDQVFCSTNSHLSEVVTHSTPTSPDCAEKAIQVRRSKVVSKIYGRILKTCS